MSRFLLFGFVGSDGRGGLQDLVATYDHMQDAQAMAQKLFNMHCTGELQYPEYPICDTFQILDTQSGAMQYAHPSARLGSYWDEPRRLVWEAYMLSRRQRKLSEETAKHNSTDTLQKLK